MDNRYIAKLTGEIDGHTVVREFWDVVSAKVWLHGDGLAEFDDQTAFGEVRSADCELIWRKSGLQTPDRAKRNEAKDWNRFFARHNITPKSKKD
jgi:hypothetical protein